MLLTLLTFFFKWILSFQRPGTYWKTTKKVKGESVQDNSEVDTAFLQEV